MKLSDDFDKAFARDYYNTFIDGLRDLTDDEKEDTMYCIPTVAFEALLLLLLSVCNDKDSFGIVNLLIEQINRLSILTDIKYGDLLDMYMAKYRKKN